MDISTIEYNKISKVILSCKTKAQLKGAYNMFCLWEKKYEWYIERGNTGLNYYLGSLTGLLRGMLQTIKT